MSVAPSHIPVTILTGFLGSGKTTLLRKLLASERMERTAVIINEFGEVGLDHLLVRELTDTAVVLQNGCICCTIRADVRSSLRELIDGQSTGSGSRIDRIVLETTGLADPVPIVQTLIGDPMLRCQTKLSGIVATIDGLKALEQFATHPESVRQAAIADRLVLTKSDIASAAAMEQLRSHLSTLNPLGRLVDANRDAISAEQLILHDDFSAKSNLALAAQWRDHGAKADLHEPLGHRSHHDSRHEVTSSVFRTEALVDWTAVGVWLSSLVHRYGSNILRIKGLLHTTDTDGPLLFNAVQNVIHQPIHLETWPDHDHSTRVVFIARGLDADHVVRSLEAFLGMASQP